MDCRDVTEYLLGMDNEESLPAAVDRHLRECSRCRREFDALSGAVAALRVRPVDPIDPVLTVRVMDAVRHEAQHPEEPPTSLRNWVIIGTILLAGLLGLRFSDVMDWLRNSFGPAIDVAMSVILGVFLTGYICVLVASNLRRVERAFRFRLRG